MKRSSGFSLVEVVIALAILAVLTTFAMSQYYSYIARAQLSEAVIMENSILKEALSFYYDTGKCVADDDPFQGTYYGRYGYFIVGSYDFEGDDPTNDSFLSDPKKAGPCFILYTTHSKQYPSDDYSYLIEDNPERFKNFEDASLPMSNPLPKNFRLNFYTNIEGRKKYSFEVGDDYYSTEYAKYFPKDYEIMDSYMDRDEMFAD